MLLDEFLSRFKDGMELWVKSLYFLILCRNLREFTTCEKIVALYPKLLEEMRMSRVATDISVLVPIKFCLLRSSCSEN